MSIPNNISSSLKMIESDKNLVFFFSSQNCPPEQFNTFYTAIPVFFDNEYLMDFF